jgi:ATP-dependent helicase/nuclease subunit A
MLGGRQVIANIERLLEMVRTREQEGFFTLFDLKDWLELSVDDSDKEGQAQLEASGDAVRIMTVHASKGLEFPIVILPETDAVPRNDSDEIALTDAGMFAEVPSPDPMVTYVPAPMRRAGEVTKAKSDAQNLRLFYVATTRAKDHLVMLGARKRKEGGWVDLGVNEKNWFSLTMNALELSSAGDGVIEFDGERTMTLRMGTFEDGDARSGPLVPEPCSVPLAVKGMSAASYGTLVHEVLRGKSVRALLAAQGLELTMDDHLAAIKGLEEVRERFMASEVMRNRKEGGMDLQELPFELRDGDTLYMGVIDRLVEMRDGSWALIDYKTVSHGADDHEVVNYFKEQMRIYRDATRGFVSGNVAEFIFLTESSMLVGL